MVTLSDLKETSCNCPKCISMCTYRPCWGTPEEIERIIDAGFAHKLMYDYWVGRLGGFREDGDEYSDLPIIAPAIVGYEGDTSPFWPMGRCCMLDENDRCKIYDIRPIESRVSHHDVTHDINVHMEIAKTWNTSEGARVVEKWKKAVGK